MKCVARIIGLSFASLVLAGCGGSSPSPSSESPTAASSPATAPQTLQASMTAPPVVAHSSPADAVAAFYEALRKGDDSAIAGLLTEKAKAETAKSGLGIQSQASQGLRYEIRETEFVTEALDGAYVSSLWTEPGPDGQLVSTEVVWVLRKEQGGWRVSGMATPLADGQTPLLFNFEDPEDMQEKKAYAEAHLTDVHEDTPEPVGQAALPQAEMAAGGVERR